MQSWWLWLSSVVMAQSPLDEWMLWPLNPVSRVLRNTKELLVNFSARLWALQCLRIAVSSLILLPGLGDFQLTLQSTLPAFSWWGDCSPSFHSRGFVGILDCSDICKVHYCVSRSFLPNSWQEFLVELDALMIALSPATSGSLQWLALLFACLFSRKLRFIPNKQFHPSPNILESHKRCWWEDVTSPFLSCSLMPTLHGQTPQPLSCSSFWLVHVGGT